MATFPTGFFGPHPKYAVVPVLLTLGMLGWIAANNPAPVASADALTVVAMKPVEGAGDAAPAASPTPVSPAPVTLGSAEIPVEVLYGVPSARTMHLWSPQG